MKCTDNWLLLHKNPLKSQANFDCGCDTDFVDFQSYKLLIPNVSNMYSDELYVAEGKRQETKVIYLSCEVFKKTQGDKELSCIYFTPRVYISTDLGKQFKKLVQ